MIAGLDFVYYVIFIGYFFYFIVRYLYVILAYKLAL